MLTQMEFLGISTFPFFIYSHIYLQSDLELLIQPPNNNPLIKKSSKS